MSKTKINPAYVQDTITAVKGSNLSKSKQDTVVKILELYLKKCCSQASEQLPDRLDKRCKACWNREVQE